jgi:hypothetical protein
MKKSSSVFLPRKFLGERLVPFVADKAQGKFQLFLVRFYVRHVYLAVHIGARLSEKFSCARFSISILLPLASYRSPDLGSWQFSQ